MQKGLAVEMHRFRSKEVKKNLFGQALYPKATRLLGRIGQRRLAPAGEAGVKRVGMAWAGFA